MKYILIYICIFLIPFSSFSQTLVDDAQLFLGIEGVESGEKVIHYIDAEGAVWGDK